MCGMFGICIYLFMYVYRYICLCVCACGCVYTGVGFEAVSQMNPEFTSLASQLALGLPWPGFLGAGSTGGPPATTFIWLCLGSQPSTDFYINLCKHGHQNIFFLYMALNDHFTSFLVHLFFLYLLPTWIFHPPVLD